MWEDSMWWCLQSVWRWNWQVGGPGRWGCNYHQESLWNIQQRQGGLPDVHPPGTQQAGLKDFHLRLFLSYLEVPSYLWSFLEKIRNSSAKERQLWVVSTAIPKIPWKSPKDVRFYLCMVIRLPVVWLVPKGDKYLLFTFLKGKENTLAQNKHQVTIGLSRHPQPYSSPVHSVEVW